MSALTCPPCRVCDTPAGPGWPDTLWRRVLGAWDWICRGCAAWATEETGR